MVHDSDYRPALSTSELIAEITRLQSEQRAIESLLCRYLADLSDRVDERGYDVIGGFADIYHAARCLFGMSVRRTRECVRIGRALRQLPRIEQAFVQGRLAYARVREVTHHRMLHEEGILITGDPEGQLAFRDPHGVAIGDDGVRGSLRGVTQGGSHDGARLELRDVSGEGRRLLDVMGHRGGWHIDGLCNETGLAVGAVASALMAFELEGRVRRDARGGYAVERE